MVSREKPSKKVVCITTWEYTHWVLTPYRHILDVVLHHSGSFPKGVIPGCSTKTLRPLVCRENPAKKGAPLNQMSPDNASRMFRLSGSRALIVLLLPILFLQPRLDSCHEVACHMRSVCLFLLVFFSPRSSGSKSEKAFKYESNAILKWPVSFRLPFKTNQ